jgi:hypothetical protein
MHRHRRRTRTPERQPDLFLTPQRPAAEVGPGWSGLPDVTQQAVMALMTRLLVAHAGGKAPRAGDGADER